MTNCGLLKAAILLAIAATVLGRPTSNVGVETEEIKQARLEVIMAREERPCYARYREVEADLKQYKKIQGGPNYVPECVNNGTKWRAAQCDHRDAGTCFCVREENGEILERTRDLNTNKEAMPCALNGRKQNGDYSGQECFHMRDKFNQMQKEYGLTGESPLPYYPDCTTNGTFMALQRNDMSKFFCVDTKTGTVIPETETEASATPPLTEDLCEAYDEVWQDFKQWNSIRDGQTQDKEINANSCGAGFIFTSCGCPVRCTHRTTHASLTSCQCKPACTCPKDMVELEGKCVTLEECHEAKPQSKAPQADKLNDLTNGDYSRWNEYKKLNPNAVLETYNSLGMPKGDSYASGPIAYDMNPNSRMLYMEPPPEEPVEGNNFGYFGAEPIPIQGENVPVLRQVLAENGPEIEEVEELHESGNLYGTEEPRGSIGGEPIPVEGQDLPILLEVNREGRPTLQEVEEQHEEEEFTEWEEEEGPTEEENPTSHEEEEEYSPEESQEEKEEIFSPEEESNNYSPEENTQTPEEEEEEEYSPEEESNNSSPEERIQAPEEEVEDEMILPEEATNTEYISPEEEGEEFNEETLTEEVEDEHIPSEEEKNTEYVSSEEEEEEYSEESFTEEVEDELTPSEEAVSTYNINPEEEDLDQENIRGEVEQEENDLISDEDNENYQEHQNLEVEEPTEETEPENETDERLIGDEVMEHQDEFSSVPAPEHDVLQQHQSSTPCEEELNSSPETPNENENALAEIDRVLIENGVVPPKPIEATLEKPSPSLKKHLNG